MNVKDVADICNVGCETVRRWLRSGKLKGSYRSRKEGYIITQDALVVFMQERNKKAKVDDEEELTWMLLRKLLLKHGKMECRVEMDGILITMDIRSVELKDVRKSTNQHE